MSWLSRVLRSILRLTQGRGRRCWPSFLLPTCLATVTPSPPLSTATALQIEPEPTKWPAEAKAPYGQNETGPGSTVTPLPVDEALAEEIYYPTLIIFG